MGNYENKEIVHSTGSLLKVKKNEVEDSICFIHAHYPCISDTVKTLLGCSAP